MAFIRVKNIKGKKYAYLAKNRWLKTKKRPKQKIVKYLGKVIEPEPTFNEISFFEYRRIIDTEEYINKNDKEKILSDLIEFELHKHDSKEYLISFDKKKFQLKQNKREIVLKINEGYLCTHTASELINFNQTGDEEQVGIALANAFVNSGIAVPKELFIGFFSKIFKY